MVKQNFKPIWIDIDLDLSFDDELPVDNLVLFDRIHESNLHSYKEMMNWQKGAIRYSLDAD